MDTAGTLHFAGWAALDFRPTERERRRDCIAPPLLAYVARMGIERARPSGWTRIAAEKAGPAVGIKPHTVGTELRQMAKRGTIELNPLGDGDYDVKITDAGRARLEG